MQDVTWHDLYFAGAIPRKDKRRNIIRERYPRDSTYGKKPLGLSNVKRLDRNFVFLQRSGASLAIDLWLSWNSASIYLFPAHV